MVNLFNKLQLYIFVAIFEIHQLRPNLHFHMVMSVLQFFFFFAHCQSLTG